MILKSWTPEEDAELLRYVDAAWPAGAFVAVLKRPASHIAARMTEKFGRLFTKNAVLSRLRRMKPTRG